MHQFNGGLLALYTKSFIEFLTSTLPYQFELVIDGITIPNFLLLLDFSVFFLFKIFNVQSLEFHFEVETTN